MTNRNTGEEHVSPWYIVPVLVAFLPVILAFAFAESPVLRVVFGGWNLVVLIPAFYWVSYLMVDAALKKRSGKG